MVKSNEYMFFYEGDPRPLPKVDPIAELLAIFHVINHQFTIPTVIKDLYELLKVCKNKTDYDMLYKHSENMIDDISNAMRGIGKENFEQTVNLLKLFYKYLDLRSK